MTIMQPLSLSTIAARLAALGMISNEHAEQCVAALDWRDEKLSDQDVPDVLVELGVAVSAHGGDVDDLETTYHNFLTAAAALTSSVTVTDVRLDDDEGAGEVLRFMRNGEPRTWRVEHSSDDYLDHLALFENIDDLAPSGEDPRRFHVLGQSEPDDDSFYILATAEQARVLRDEFGLDLG